MAPPTRRGASPSCYDRTPLHSTICPLGLEDIMDTYVILRRGAWSSAEELNTAAGRSKKVGGARGGSGVSGRAALALAFGGTALGRQAPLARCRGGTCGTAALGSDERAREPRAQASQSQLAVARLRSLVLRDRHQARSGARQQPPALCVAQRLRGEHVEARLHAGGRDVGMLSPGAGGAACADRDLREGNRQLAGDPQPSTSALVGFRRWCHRATAISRGSRASRSRADTGRE